MFRLIKKLFSNPGGTHRVVVINDDEAKPSRTYRIYPVNLWLLVIGILAGVIILVILLVRFSPLGGIVYRQKDLRKSVITIQQQVAAMEDTLLARNEQLQQMKQVIATGNDTSFGAISSSNNRAGNRQVSSNKTPAKADISNLPAHLPVNVVLISNLFKNAPDFPAPYPLKGSNTRGFNTDIGHYGLDIAAPAGAPFKAIADGVIISEEWTFNYGYMIMVQHPGGVICIYKHAQTLSKAIGETVRQGQLLGTIGQVGILSSGPHLHIEIWKNGIPQNPKRYLIK